MDPTIAMVVMVVTKGSGRWCGWARLCGTEGLAKSASPRKRWGTETPDPPIKLITISDAMYSRLVDCVSVVVVGGCSETNGVHEL
jgi:hypothetical protein